MRAIVDARKAMKSARKALEKIERDKINCGRKDYKGVRTVKCLPSGEMCEACKGIYDAKRDDTI